jgi:hypothetical protein
MEYWTMIAPLIVAGAGISMAIPAAQNAAVSSVNEADVGKASGTFTMMRQLGGVFGLAIVVAVFGGSGSYASPHAFSDGFGPAIGVCGAFSLIAALTAVAIPARSTARTRQPQAAVTTEPETALEPAA